MTLRHKRLFWIVALVVVTLDLITKSMVFSALNAAPADLMKEGARVHHETIDVVGDSVKLVALMNKGMMWGKFQDYHAILRIFRLGAVLVIFYLLLDMDPKQKWGLCALGGILGGAVGNIYDSIAYQGVRDFLYFNFGFAPFDPWPAFNVADSAICVGVFILALTMLFRPQPKKTSSEDSAEGPQDGTEKAARSGA